MKAIAYQKLTVTDTAVGLAVPSGALRAVLGFLAHPDSTLEICARFREDGQAPTTERGMPLAHMGSLEVVGANLATFSIVSTDTFTHELNIQYYA